MQQVRIIDPNFMAYRLNEFNNGGRKLLSILKDSGVDRDVRDNVRVYLANQSSSMVNKKQINTEVSRHANPLLMAGASSATFGLYNPDTIPVDTYLRMKTDPQIAIGLAMIKLPLYSLGWIIECEDTDIREFVKEIMARIWRRLLRSMLTAVDFGFASHEIVWELLDLEVASQSPNGRKKTHFSGKAETIKKIKAHYPSTVRIRTDAATDDFIGITQQSPTGGMVSLDAPKCFLFVLQDEFGNWFGQSRLKAAYKAWYWKEVLQQFMLRYFERKGSPSTVISHPVGGGITRDGQEYDNTEIALRIGSNLVENSVVTLPYEADREGKNQWDIKYLADDRRGEMFVNALNYLSAQILRGLLTPERVMTQDISTGSYGMATSHAEIFLLSLEGLAAEMSDAINMQIIPKIVEYNFKPKKIVPCRLSIEKIQYDRKRILKEILVEVIRNLNTWMASGKTPNIMPSIEQMSDILGVPLVQFEEEYTSTAVPGSGEVDANGNPIPIDPTNQPVPEVKGRQTPAKPGQPIPVSQKKKKVVPISEKGKSKKVTPTKKPN
jgi:hypothetical protein